MQIREATVAEIPAIVKLGRRAYEWATGKTDFKEDVSAGNWIHLVQSGEGVVFAVYDADIPVGFICGYKARNIDTGRATAQMWHWFVGPQAKGQGVFLLKRFERWAKEHGCSAVGMGCLPQLWSDRHRGIYERLGYKLDGMSFGKEIQ